jgi:hypothetical protein
MIYLYIAILEPTSQRHAAHLGIGCGVTQAFLCLDEPPLCVGVFLQVNEHAHLPGDHPPLALADDDLQGVGMFILESLLVRARPTYDCKTTGTLQVANCRASIADSKLRLGTKHYGLPSITHMQLCI